MNVSQVKAGDVIEVEMRGWTFLAYVDSVHKEKGSDTKLMITPAVKNCSHHHCYANDVQAHYVKQGRIRQPAKKKTKAVKKDAEPLAGSAA